MESVQNLCNMKHPVKYYTRSLCSMLYYLGICDIWYEEIHAPIFKIIHPVTCVISHVYLFIVIINEGLTLLKENTSVTEQQTALRNCSAHFTVYIKFVIILMKTKEIKKFFKDMFEVNSAIYRCLDLEEAAKRRGKINSWILIFTMFCCLFMGTVDAFQAHLNTGVPFKPIYTYWPLDDQTGTLVNICRFFIQFHWWYIVGIMIVVDSICLITMIFLASRFKALCRYFENIYKDGEEQMIIHRELHDEIVKKFVTGIQMHITTLWCVDNVRNALGAIYSVQVLQSIVLIAICLIKFVVNELTFTFVMANFAYIQCMICLTATYMISAGDITYEAGLLPTAIFHCGWEKFGKDSYIRMLVTMSIQRSQVPVVITVFGIFALSYASLITILRASYSFFAVMY